MNIYLRVVIIFLSLKGWSSPIENEDHVSQEDSNLIFSSSPTASVEIDSFNLLKINTSTYLEESQQSSIKEEDESSSLPVQLTDKDNNTTPKIQNSLQKSSRLSQSERKSFSSPSSLVPARATLSSPADLENLEGKTKLEAIKQEQLNAEPSLYGFLQSDFTNIFSSFPRFVAQTKDMIQRNKRNVNYKEVKLKEKSEALLNHIIHETKWGILSSRTEGCGEPNISAVTDESKIEKLCMHGKIFAAFKSTENNQSSSSLQPMYKISQGSGVMIGKNKVLTAGHNLVLQDKEAKRCKVERFADHIVFLPGLYDPNIRHFGYIDKYRVPVEWGDRENFNFDIGVLHLTTDLGTETGFMDLVSDDSYFSNDQEITITGYPGLGVIRGIIHSDVRYITDQNNMTGARYEHKIFYQDREGTNDLLTAPGYSGCAAYVEKEEKLLLAAIHTTAPDLTTKVLYSGGIKLDKKIRNIVKALANMRMLKEEYIESSKESRGNISSDDEDGSFEERDIEGDIPETVEDDTNENFVVKFFSRLKF